VTTEDLIIRLAGSAGVVRPIAPPMRRFGVWAGCSVALTVLGVALIGVRPDSWIMVQRPGFLITAGVTMATGLIAAGAALVLSVPGAEGSAAQRWSPVAICAAWTTLLTMSVLSGGAGVARMMALPFHTGCAVQIAALALLPGWMLFAMLRGAAPLRRSWSGGLATLGAVALAATGTQFLCPIDDPAHLLVGHLVPVAAFAVAGALIGSRALRTSPAAAGVWRSRGTL
jgi:hypothetical protein